MRDMARVRRAEYDAMEVRVPWLNHHHHTSPPPSPTFLFPLLLLWHLGVHDACFMLLHPAHRAAARRGGRTVGGKVNRQEGTLTSCPLRDVRPRSRRRPRHTTQPRQVGSLPGTELRNRGGLNASKTAAGGTRQEETTVRRPDFETLETSKARRDGWMRL
ncbi:hypothetical protein LZ32DRAFT_28859 [Colletotrichum eremochloae]|nr:hypothetical protein LZ32DRAFT_28859 [Colletotrichum eremochloae]